MHVTQIFSSPCGVTLHNSVGGGLLVSILVISLVHIVYDALNYDMSGELYWWKADETFYFLGVVSEV